MSTHVNVLFKLVSKTATSFLLFIPLAFATDNTCQSLQTQVESALLIKPDDVKLQAAWLALQQCQNPSQQSVQQSKPTSINLISVSAGYEQNPGLLATQGQLSLWSGSNSLINLPLARQTHPSAFLQTHWLHQHHLQNGIIIANALLKSYEQPQHDTSFSGSIDYQQTRGNLTGALLGFSHQNWQNISLNQLRTGWHLALTDNLYTQLDWREKRYPQQSQFDSRQWGVLLGGHLPWQGWMAEASIFYDQAIAERAGGDQWGKEVRIGWQTSLGQQQLMMGAWLRQQQDQQIYSSVIVNNPKRDLLLKGMVLRWQTSAYSGWQPFVQAELWQQEANIGLFRWQNQSVQAGIRWLW